MSTNNLTNEQISSMLVEPRINTGPNAIVRGVASLITDPKLNAVHMALVIEMPAIQLPNGTWIRGDVHIFRAGGSDAGLLQAALFQNANSAAAGTAANRFYVVDYVRALGYTDLGQIPVSAVPSYLNNLSNLATAINSTQTSYPGLLGQVFDPTNSNAAYGYACSVNGFGQACTQLPIDPRTGRSAWAQGLGTEISGMPSLFQLDVPRTRNANGSVSVILGNETYKYGTPDGFDEVQRADGSRDTWRTSTTNLGFFGLNDIRTTNEMVSYDAQQNITYKASYDRYQISRQSTATEIFFSGGQETARIVTQFTGMGDNFSQTVSVGNTDIRYGLNEDGDLVAQQVLRINGTDLDGDAGLRAAEALKFEGINPGAVTGGNPHAIGILDTYDPAAPANQPAGPTEDLLDISVIPSGGGTVIGVLGGGVEGDSTHQVSITDPTSLNYDQATTNASGQIVQDNVTNSAFAIVAGYVRPGDERATEDWWFYYDTPGIWDAGIDLGLPWSGFNSWDLGLGLSDLDYGGQLLLPTDPVVLDLNGDGVHLTDQTLLPVLFDIDHDGDGAEKTGWISALDGLLVKDLDNNGKVDSARELISEFFGGAVGDTPFADGFDALRSLETNADGSFTESEAQAQGVRVWVDADHDGQTDAGELKTFTELGIVQINLAGQSQSGLVRDGNEVVITSTFAQNVNAQGQGVPVGTAGSSTVAREVVGVNLLANPFGSTITDLGGGSALISTQGDAVLGTTKVYASGSSAGEIIDLATAGTGGTAVDNAVGGTGNDVLNGTALNNWLAGGPGSDTFNAGAGNDVLLIDAQDLQSNIHAGAGIDIVQIVGNARVTLNLALAEVEVGQGGRYNDILIGGGRSTVYIRGGGGDDVIIGGAANDALSGENGDDLIDGGQGNDVLRGDRGRDLLLGGMGQDVIHGGLGDDSLKGGADSDWLAGEQGDDEIDGGEGVNIAKFTGSYADYRLTRIDETTWWISDLVASRDGSDILRNIQRIGFRDVSTVDLTLPNPMPVRDVVAATPTVAGGNVFLVKVQDLLRNDIDYQGDAMFLREIPVASISGGTIAGTISTNPSGVQVVTPTLTSNGELTFTRVSGYTGFMGFDYYIRDSQGNNGATVQLGSTSQNAELKAQVVLTTPELPSDPLVTSQWYLAEANVLPVWKDYTGKGVRIVQVEVGSNQFAVTKEIFDYRHPDLQPNVDPQWFASGKAGEGSEEKFSSHATRVAGVMVGAKNGDGVVGVAYDAKLAGYWLANPGGEPDSDLTSLLRFRQYDIANNSWGTESNFSLDANGSLAEFLDAAYQGRRGLGTVLVFAGGNERQDGGNANYSNLSNSRVAITTAAIKSEGDLGALVISGAPFSNPGAAILIAAPGSNVTSSSTVIQNNQGTVFGNSVAEDSGTSYATPIVSGIVALMLEANPNLGYRDVQEILAISARQFTDTNADWHFNAAANWNGGAMHVSHDYGFGKVDAYAAVRLAETWGTQQTGANEIFFANPLSSGFD